MSFESIFESATKLLEQRHKENKVNWYHADGTPKKNCSWNLAAKTIQGDAGEQVVKGIFKQVYEKLYEGYTVDVEIVGLLKGKNNENYDVKVVVKGLNIIIKIEVKTATQGKDGSYQWNSLKKHLDYDYAFGLGVRPDDFVFSIQPLSRIKQLTTLMSKAIEDVFKWSPTKKDNVIELTEENFIKRLEELDLA